MIGGKVQQPEPELSIKHLNFPSPILKLVATFSGMGWNQLFLIPQILVDPLILVRRQDLREKSLSFLCCTFLKVRESLV